MAKLDEFGRPIYETAEEYNRAHKGGVCPRSYDSPVGENYQQKSEKKKHRYQSVAQRHATVQGSKNAKKMIVIIAAFVIFFNVGIIFSMVASIFNDSNIEMEFEQSEESYGEYLGDGETPLPEGFEVFSYNGEYYSIPSDYREISQMGFVLEEYTEDDAFPAGFESMLSLYDEDGYMRAMIRIVNNTDADILLKKCIVDYFYMENPAIFDDTVTIPDFVFCNGLTFESTYEDVEAYLGMPYYHYEDHSEEGYYYDQYQWMYYKESDGDSNASDEIHFVQIFFYNGVIESVSLEKTVVEDKY